MSQQPRVLPDTAIIRRPEDLDLTRGIVEQLDPRVHYYAICTNKTSSGPPRSPEEETFTFELYAEVNNLFVDDKLISLQDFAREVSHECGISARGVVIWMTTDLSPAKRIESDEQFLATMNAFLVDPSQKWMEFFIQFYGTSESVPQRSSANQAVNHYAAAGGISPRHIDSGPSREQTVLPTESPFPAQPTRVNTSQSFKKGVSRIKTAVSNVKDLLSPREAVQTGESPTVLEQLAASVDQEDYLTSLLPKTNGSPSHQPAINAYQSEVFRHFCRLFPHIDPRQRGNERVIGFKNSTLTVTPHQFTRACQMLFQEHHSGGFLASQQGVGKSHLILCAVVIRSLIFESRRRVEREHHEVAQSPQKGPAKRLEHLPRDAPRGRGLTCPTQGLRTHDVVCWCVPDGLTRQLVTSLKPGAALIQVPSAAMPGWIEILENAKFSRIAYNFTVLYSGPPLSSRLEPNLDFLRRSSKWKLGAVLPADHPGGLVDQEDLEWTFEPPEPADRNMAIETFCFVTPHHSTKLQELYMWDAKDLFPAPQRCIFPPGGLHALPVGTMFIDEAHKVLNSDSLPMKLARLHRHVSNSDIWFVSGTPFGAEATDLATAMAFLAPDRAEDAMLFPAAHEALEAAVPKTPKAIADFEAVFDKVFGGDLVIRDEIDTTWRGYPITDIQRVRPQYISRPIPQSQLLSVQSFIDAKITAGPRDAYFETIQKLRQNSQLLYLLSTFPAAARALTDAPNSPYLDLDMRRLIRQQRSTSGESLAGNKVLRSLAEQLARSPRSPKLQYILDELDRLAKDPTQRPKPATQSTTSIHVETDPALKKMVIITPTLFTAVMMYLILARFHPRSSPVLYHEDLKQSQRAEVLRKFNSLRKREGPWRVFVAPASVASEALNLQIANSLVLTSPLVNSQQESQALARVNRMGQTLKVKLSILAFEESPIDRILIAHRAGMRFESDPFNLEQEISVAR